MKIYLAFIFMPAQHTERRFKHITCYIPAASSHEAELMLRQERFALMSQADAVTYIQTDEAKAEAEANGDTSLIVTRDSEFSHTQLMTVFELHNWVQTMSQGEGALYRRALP